MTNQPLDPPGGNGNPPGGSGNDASPGSPAINGNNGKRPPTSPHIGLALGGGSARGLAHVLMLEAIDDLGLTPARIVGTSIGAIMGAAYAAGLSGTDIREFCQQLLGSKFNFLKRFGKDLPDSLTALWSLRSAPIVDGVSFFEIVMPESVHCDFAGLKIPFTAITVDFYAMQEWAISHGPVIPAITASSALPTLMRPVEIEGRVLIDGGFSNPTPYDLLLGKPDIDITVAIDVTGNTGQRRNNGLPGSFDGWGGAAQIMFHSITREKLKNARPDIFIHPAVGGFGTLDFFQLAEIFEAAKPAKEDLKRQLSAAIENFERSRSR